MTTPRRGKKAAATLQATTHIPSTKPWGSEFLWCGDGHDRDELQPVALSLKDCIPKDIRVDENDVASALILAKFSEILMARGLIDTMGAADGVADRGLYLPATAARNDPRGDICLKRSTSIEEGIL